jgi:hypothetical protein
VLRGNYYRYMASESDTEKQKDDITGAKIGATTQNTKQVWEKEGTLEKKGKHLEREREHI